MEVDFFFSSFSLGLLLIGTHQVDVSPLHTVLFQEMFLFSDYNNLDFMKVILILFIRDV